MRLFVLSVLPFLAACAGTIEPKQFSGPNGKPAYSMECSGMGRTLDGCYKKAGEICPTGYNVVGQTTGTVGVPTAQGGTLMIPTHSFAVECK